MCTQNQFTVQMFMKPVYSTDLENWKSWQLKERKKGEHTCPEVLIKLSELIKGLSINTNYNLAIISVFTVFKYCDRYVLTNSISLINASGQVCETWREHHRLQSLELLLFAAKKLWSLKSTFLKDLNRKILFSIERLIFIGLSIFSLIEKNMKCIF